MPGETVIVNFLPNTLGNNELRTLFHSVGNITQSNVVRNNHTGQSRCFGFITFSNSEEANRAVRVLNGRRVQDKTIRVSISVTSEEMANSAKVYVAGLPLVWSDKDLTQHFDQFGKILNSRVLFEQNTGVSRGVGFVTFENYNDAQNSIDTLNGVPPEGETVALKVLMAKKQDEMNADGGQPDAPAAGSGGAGGGADLDPACNVMVNFLPESWGDQELRQLFSSIGQINRLKVVTEKTTGQSKCYGFVLFENPEDAQRACKSLNGRLVQNKAIKVAMAVREEEGKLYIGNFPLNWTDIELTSLLDPFGVIVSARVLYDKQTGLARGCGFAAMETRDQAQAAIDSLAGSRVPGSHQPLKIHFPVDPKGKAIGGGGGGVGGGGGGVGGGVGFNYGAPGAAQMDYSDGIGGGGSAAKKRRFDGSSLTDQIRSGGGMPPVDGLPTHHHHPYAAASTAQYHGAGSMGAMPASMSHHHHNASMACHVNAPAPPGFSGDQCIFVHGLDEKVEDIELWQLFGPFGAVKNVRVIRTKEDTCQGYGFVTMVRYHEACEAITHLNGRTYAKKMLQVRFKGHGGDIYGGVANGSNRF